jgi:biotin-[acetyl-CoA-carboxylase] ligase BirA-like protein
MINDVSADYNLIVFDQLTSTSDYILNNLSKLSNKTCVIANCQTAGRATNGNNWVSRTNIDVTCSILYCLQPTMNYSILPLLTSLAVVNTYIQFGINPMVKWPNDIYCHYDLKWEVLSSILNYTKFINNYMKVSGILIDVRTVANNCYIVVGIGLDNIMNQDRDVVFNRLLFELDQIYSSLCHAKTDFIAQWLSYCMHYNKLIHVLDKQDGKVYIGKNIGVNAETGGILLNIDSKTIDIVNGKIVNIEF